jgi:murein DD-endopeptidase MepM/ murein hydrolase activator NlpD
MLATAQLSWAQDGAGQLVHKVQPGDTWTALAWRYGVEEQSIRSLNPHPNRQRQPAIGSVIIVPDTSIRERTGRIYSGPGGLIKQAIKEGASPWQVAILNGVDSPYEPLLYKPVFLPIDEDLPRQFPGTVRSLEVSRAPAQPGQALAIRGLGDNQSEIAVRFSDESFNVFRNGSRFVALAGTGAFFEPGEYALQIQVEGEPLWTQPWSVAPGDWTYEQINYTGAAAAIDAEAIRQERERLASIWSQPGEQPLWSGPFGVPLTDYLEVSSQYGARRSYSGGPYDRYHEGLDFSAYGGTPVYSPAAGAVSLAENLVARGGAVLLDHGLGLFSGFYHLSEILVEAGQFIPAGQIVGRVGSTGLSTGNHLHWDLLVNGTWVDAAAWLEQDMACWLLEGWGAPCASS